MFRRRTKLLQDLNNMGWVKNDKMIILGWSIHLILSNTLKYQHWSYETFLTALCLNSWNNIWGNFCFLSFLFECIVSMLQTFENSNPHTPIFLSSIFHFKYFFCLIHWPPWAVCSILIIQLILIIIIIKILITSKHLHARQYIIIYLRSYIIYED